MHQEPCVVRDQLTLRTGALGVGVAVIWSRAELDHQRRVLPAVGYRAGEQVQGAPLRAASSRRRPEPRVDPRLRDIAEQLNDRYVESPRKS